MRGNIKMFRGLAALAMGLSAYGVPVYAESLSISEESAQVGDQTSHDSMGTISGATPSPSTPQSGTAGSHEC